jgi:O-antigen/teichoic acid export membrane protein
MVQATPKITRPFVLSSATVWSAAGTFLWAASSLITSVLISRFLGPAEAGSVFYITWLTTTVGILTGLALPETLLRFQSELRSSNEHIPQHYLRWISSRFLVATFLGVLLLLGILTYSQRTVTTGILLALTVALFVIQRLGMLGRSFLLGGHRFRDFATVSFVSLTVQIALSISLFRYPYSSVAISAYIGSFLIYVFPLLYFRQSILGSNRAASNKAAVLRRRLTSYALWTWGAVSLSTIVHQRSEVYFLERFGSPEEVAFFSTGFLVVSILNQLPTLLSGPLVPYFAGHQGIENAKTKIHTYRISTIAVVYATVPMFVLLVILADPITVLLYGTDFSQAALVVKGLAIAGIFSSVVVPANALLYGIERQRIITIISAFSSALLILVGFFLIPRWGLIAAVAGKVIVQTLSNIMTLLFVHFRVRWDVPIGQVARLFAGAVFGGIVANSIYRLSGIESPVLNIAASAISGLVIYYLFCRIFGVWKPEETKMLRRSVEAVTRGSPALARWICSIMNCC